MKMHEIPETWSKKKIGDIGEVVGGGTPPTKEKLYYGGDIAWITPKDLSSYDSVFISRGERSITKLGLRNSSARLMPAGTVLFTSRAPIGYVAIAINEVSTNQGFKSIICDLKIADNIFIYYALKYNKNNIENIATGSTFKEINGDNLKKFEILLPPFAEQKEIAKILFCLDEKIEVNRKNNKTLENIGQLIFKRWFVEFEFPNEEGKPYRASGGEMVDSELGEIPKGWNTESFSELININPLRKLSKGKIVKKIGMTDLVPWQSWIETYEMEPYSSSPKFQNGDVLFARITPSLEHGKTALVSFLDLGEVAFGSTEFIIFAPKIIRSSYYIYFLAIIETIRETAIKAMTGSSGRQRVPNDCFDHITICSPPENLLMKFHNTISPLFERININVKESKNLKQIRDLILPKLMSGEIRVRIPESVSP